MWLSRQILAIGEENTQKLKDATVMVFGLGGVGGAAVEALCRVGIGKLILIDGDIFEETNLNRQILSTRNNLGHKKTEVAKKRLLSINNQLVCETIDLFYLPNNINDVFKENEKIDYIIDAVDTLTAKLNLVAVAQEKKIPIISSMGMGNRIDPSKVKTGDVFDTVGSGCGLSRMMRRELRRREINNLLVVYSDEKPRSGVVVNTSSSKHSPGSTALVPPVAGYFLASSVFLHIINR